MFKIGDKIVCIDIENNCADKHLEIGKEYTVSLEEDGILVLEGVPHEWMVSRFVLASEYNKVEAVKEENNVGCVKPIDTHYNYYYTLTQADIDAGKVKVDAYFVSQQWKLGSKDETGALFHCLKTITRYGEKNPVEREINALYKQVNRLAELNGVVLE